MRKGPVTASLTQGAWDDLASSRRDLPIFRPGEQFEGGGPDRRPTILALASGDDAGGEASDGRHFEILLNLTFGRAPASKGLPSKRRIWFELLLPADRWRSDDHRRSF